ncbi:hypothetical protein ACD591_17735 [Rufibacter glacialis]|uniref:DUF3575 domain-containing protein n=1 Tax=Rufibacter glacialis TaxID=1259555 RepID=A0A5M8Q478_9BACT|nr:hypothetical protein [Rufibacter glacialis]KAA6430687.1 hypothetical protein FOE74_19660 [Rufibacter glacialis]GGK85807.1 hypothetical protein GCM10011405_37060 [Rufibacter glacialis]
MKPSLLVFLWFCSIQVVSAQDSTSTALQRLYFQVSSTVPLASDQTYIFQLSITGSIKTGSKENLLDFSTGLYGLSFTDRHLSGLKYRDEQRPIHELGGFYFSVGKIASMGKTSFGSFFVGPSFVKYDMPYNITQTPSSGWWGSTGLTYDTRTYLMLGGTAQADFAFFPIKLGTQGSSSNYEKNIGVSVGGLVHWNRKLTSWGLNLGIIIGGRAVSN